MEYGAVVGVVLSYIHERRVADIRPPAACELFSKGEVVDAGLGCTVSATEIVSFRSFSRVASSCTISRSSGGGNAEVDIVVVV